MIKLNPNLRNFVLDDKIIKFCKKNDYIKIYEDNIFCEFAKNKGEKTRYIIQIDKRYREAKIYLENLVGELTNCRKINI